MKKILIPFDGANFPESALNFARQLNKGESILLTGAFLPQVNYANLWSYSGGGKSGNDFIPLVEDEDAEAITMNIARFEQFCNTNEIRYKIHKEYFNFALPELKKETRFADLLIISSEVFYEQAGSRTANDYLQDALHDVECPVIVVPDKFEYPTSNIIAYDGSEASVYAIKQFAYLFPALASLPTILIYSNEKGEAHFPEESNIEELTSLHFPQITWSRLHAKPKDYLNTWLINNKNAMMICGAFGRSGMSRLFRKSFATDIISEHKIPVFISHK